MEMKMKTTFKKKSHRNTFEQSNLEQFFKLIIKSLCVCITSKLIFLLFKGHILVTEMSIFTVILSYFEFHSLDQVSGVVKKFKNLGGEKKIICSYESEKYVIVITTFFKLLSC